MEYGPNVTYLPTVQLPYSYIYIPIDGNQLKLKAIVLIVDPS